MGNHSKSEILLNLSKQVAQIYATAKPLERYLVLDCDRWALQDLLTDLYWASENLSVIAKHLRGEKLDDDMGFYDSHTTLERFAIRFLPRGVSIDERNREQFESGRRNPLRPRAPDRRAYSPKAKSRKKRR